jgi:hypothetical protein
MTDIKHTFLDKLTVLAQDISENISRESGQWRIKGFIDDRKKVYAIGHDTKLISKILEIEILPLIKDFATSNNYTLVLPDKQNYYPDFSFVSSDNPSIKFAVDLKTSYIDPDFPAHIKGFTLGSHGAYFLNRKEKKNIQYPYSDYCGHFCLCIIYKQNPVQSQEMMFKTETVESIDNIQSVCKDFELCHENGKLLDVSVY